MATSGMREFDGLLYSYLEITENMRYVVLLIVLTPLFCCQQCDQTWACITLWLSVAFLLHVALSITHELQLLAKFGQSGQGPH